MDRRVRIVLDFMHQNLKGRITVADLSTRAGVSPSEIRSLFNRDLGVPPSRYLKQLRLQKACVLLSTSQRSVKEIMAAVGCQDLSHFVRDFEAAFGLSPRRYRQGHRDGVIVGSAISPTNWRPRQRKRVTRESGVMVQVASTHYVLCIGFEANPRWEKTGPAEAQTVERRRQA